MKDWLICIVGGFCGGLAVGIPLMVLEYLYWKYCTNRWKRANSQRHNIKLDKEESVSKQDIAEKVEDYLFGVADAFDSIKRIGSDTDDPEGSRYIIVSDSMATKLSHDLRNCAQKVKDFQFQLPE